jgi:uncharacterized protein Yka (UPF0111/DUF47 family)
MRIKDLILPEDTVFFDLFDEMTGFITGASRELSELTGELPGGSARCRVIREYEHKGDGVTRQIYERLNQSLITPLEPEEISRLAPALDNILDAIDWVSHQIYNYEIPRPNEKLKEFAWMIEQCATQAETGMVLLKKMDDLKAVQERGVEINRMWNMGTELLSRSTIELFQTKDPLHIIKLKDIYESMERTLQMFNDFGHALNDIALAHG